ncbi:hypothetical protein H9W90_02430 [Polaribacter pectinis]|uniref:Uncharacterized protein n=1 Tax=Polaribacter pectinis TaxID=2738844 RepID=A0A7G9LBJ1_9FLAO|nr:hypothetical protein [Polaribacter pectinis]QNM85990.1 hypothetical protein H9W90_02430 [Polaribacter pectinis]
MIKINSSHPKFTDFISKEIKTISFLGSYSSFKNCLKELSDQAKFLSYQFPKSTKLQQKIKNLNFSFEFNLRLEKKKCTVVIESLIQKNYEQCTYSVFIKDLDNNLIRKYHFDYAPFEKMKPLYHFQYCGEETPKISEHKIDLEPFHPWMSLPRVVNYPINLALILDMILSETIDEQVKKGIEKDGWRNFMVENEKFLLKEYFKNTAGYFQNGHTSKRTFREYCYGE